MDGNAAADQSGLAVASASDCTVELPEKRKRESETQPNTEAAAPPARHPLWKTSLCSYFRSNGGVCRHGDSCRFAHNEEELRIRADNTWDPTSERAKKMAKTELNEAKEEEEGVMMTEALEERDNSSGGLSKCFVNLPMKWTSDHLRNFLNEKEVHFVSAKKKKGMIAGFVTFETVEQAKSATQELNGISIGNNRTLKVADVLPRSFEKNNKATLPHLSNQTTENPLPDSNHSSLKEGTNSDEAEVNDISMAGNCSTLKGRSARAVVTPLADMSYPDQLEHKKNSLAQILKKLTRNARKACPNGVVLPEWIQKSRERGGLPCNFEGIIESPIVFGYRNKCEFSVGHSLDGKCTVGFLLGNFREGVTAVEKPVNCPNVSQIACKYAKLFQEFLQNSCLPVWNRLNNTGFWRQLTVREGRKPHSNIVDAEPIISEVMLIVQVCTDGFEDAQVKVEIERLAKELYMGSTAETPPLPLSQLVIQDHTGISNVAPSDAHLKYKFISREGNSELSLADDSVEPRIHDHLSNLRFSISPTAFFQVNTLAAEKLYSLAGDWVGLGPETLLLDICCGTGTIGVTLAHRVGMVVGIEMNASAVSDAQRNAEINGIKNCRFVCGKAEDVIGTLMKEYNVSLAENPVNGSMKCSDEAVDDAPDSEDRSILNASEKNDKCLENEAHSSQQFKNIVAIVDPPRAGLHPTVIKVLRTQSQLKQLVYISCNPESLVANAIELCTPSPPIENDTGNDKKKNRMRGWKNMTSASLARHRAKSMPSSEPFTPVKAMAVDLFPHTPHCELVMLLQR